MTDKKLTDYAITVRALEKILELMLLEGDLQRVSTVSHAIDLINRQKAEIERLQDTLNATIAGQETLQRYIATAKAEAIKEISELQHKNSELQSEIARLNKVIAMYDTVTNKVGDPE